MGLISPILIFHGHKKILIPKFHSIITVDILKNTNQKTLSTALLAANTRAHVIFCKDGQEIKFNLSINK